MSQAVGRTRRKLASLLSEVTGKSFSPENLWPAEGWWRSSGHPFNESYRWTAQSDDKTLMLDSYDTMTKCVKCGIDIVDGVSPEILVYAKK